MKLLNAIFIFRSSLPVFLKLLPFCIYIFIFLHNSNNTYAQWSQCNGPYGGKVASFFGKDNFVLASTSAGLFRSFNDGSNWEKVRLLTGTFSSFQLHNDKIWASAGNLFFVSDDEGTTWLKYNFIDTINIASFIMNGNDIYVGTYQHGLFRSNDNGTSWHKLENNMNELTITCFSLVGGDFYAGTNDGLFLSKDNGNSWEKINFEGENIIFIKNTTNFLYVGLDNAEGLYLWSHGGGTYGGQQWYYANYGFTIIRTITDVIEHDGSLYACTDYGLYKSDNQDGSHWEQFAFYPDAVNRMIVWNNVFIIIRGKQGVFRSTDYGNSWENTGLNALGINSLLIHNNDIYAGTNSAGVFRANTQLNEWKYINKGIIVPDVLCFAKSGSNIYAGTATRGIYRSSDGGEEWNQVDSKLTIIRTTSLAALDSYIFSGAQQSKGLLRSSDFGSTWEKTSLDENINSLFTENNILYATTSRGLYSSSDFGSSWKKFNVNSSPLYVHVHGSNMVTCGGTRIHFSTDYGNTWSEKYLEGWDNYPGAVVSDAKSVYVGCRSGVIMTTNNGETWSHIGLKGINVTALTIHNNTIFAGTINESVWKADLNLIVSSVEENFNIIKQSSPTLYTTTDNTINFVNEINRQTSISYSFINSLGETIDHGVLNQNSDHVSVKIPSTLSSGYYTLTLISDKNIIHKNFLYSR